MKYVFELIWWIFLNTNLNLDNIDIELLRLIQEDAEILHLELTWVNLTLNLL